MLAILAIVPKAYRAVVQLEKFLIGMLGFVVSECLLPKDAKLRRNQWRLRLRPGVSKDRAWKVLEPSKYRYATNQEITK